jgi:protein TonB
MRAKKLLSYLTALGLGVATTFGLFYFMSALVSQGTDLKKNADTENFVEFVRVKSSESLETRTRKLPEKPAEPDAPPRTQTMVVANSKLEPQRGVASMDIPQLSSSLSLGDGPFIGGVAAVSAGNTDRGLTPLVRVEPQLPRKAALEGIEGWVKLRFDVSEDGTVDNVSVIESKPARIFDSNARQALLKWRYKPQIVDGKPVRTANQEVIMDFKFEK